MAHKQLQLLKASQSLVTVSRAKNISSPRRSQKNAHSFPRYLEKRQQRFLDRSFMKRASSSSLRHWPLAGGDMSVARRKLNLTERRARGSELGLKFPAEL